MKSAATMKITPEMEQGKVSKAFQITKLEEKKQIKGKPKVSTRRNQHCIDAAHNCQFLYRTVGARSFYEVYLARGPAVEEPGLSALCR